MRERAARAIGKSIHHDWNEHGANTHLRDAAQAALTEVRNYLAENGWTYAMIEDALK